MDLGTGTLFDLTATVADEALDAPGEPPAPSLADELLASIREAQAGIVELEIAKVRQIAAWADEHVVDEETAACTITECGLDTGLPVAGPGAPLISDFAVMQLSAVLGRTLDSGRLYVGQVVELAHRLPKLWTQPTRHRTTRRIGPPPRTPPTGGVIGMPNGGVPGGGGTCHARPRRARCPS